jgi:hypothetical protein
MGMLPPCPAGTGSQVTGRNEAFPESAKAFKVAPGGLRLGARK